MARIGLDNFLIGVLTETGETATYGAATKPGKAISCNVSITNNDASLYADNGLAESDKSFQSGTVTMGIDDDDLALQALILGCTLSAGGELTRKDTDQAPYVGFGRIVTKQVNNSYKYVVKFLSKVKFGMPSSDENTKGESVEYGTTEYEGSISKLADGTWSKEEVFDTKAAAKTYLESLFGTTPSV